MHECNSLFGRTVSFSYHFTMDWILGSLYIEVLLGIFIFENIPVYHFFFFFFRFMINSQKIYPYPISVSTTISRLQLAFKQWIKVLKLYSINHHKILKTISYFLVLYFTLSLTVDYFDAWFLLECSVKSICFIIDLKCSSTSFSFTMSIRFTWNSLKYPVQ